MDLRELIETGRPSADKFDGVTIEGATKAMKYVQEYILNQPYRDQPLPIAVGNVDTATVFVLKRLSRMTDEEQKKAYKLIEATRNILKYM